MMESIIDENKIQIFLFLQNYLMDLFSKTRIVINQKNSNWLCLGLIETIFLLIKLSKLLQIFYCR